MAELRNIKWGVFLKDLLSKDSLEILCKSRSLQWALTYCLRQQNHIIFNELEDLILEYRGIKYRPHPLNYPRVFESYDRYRIEEIVKDDVVLDLGANIGSFALPAATRALHVTAVEPLFYKDLDANRGMNHYLNLLCIQGSIGTSLVDCQEFKGTAEQMLPYWARRTFVRMDIGGAEWLINPESVLTPSVRHFEGEFHFWTKDQRRNQKLNEWLSLLERRGLGYILRWSKHKHWAYVSADKSYKNSTKVFLKDGSFTGRSKEIWNLSTLTLERP